MKKDNWLYHYSEKWAIQRSFKGLVHRAAYLTESDTAYSLFEKEYVILKECYCAFLPDLINAITSEYQLMR
jgi:acyl carrier protein phosphodiesterase